MSYKKLNIVAGERFGKLVVIVESERAVLPSGQKNRQMLCRCDCGTETVVRVVHLTRGRTISCGCMVGEKHGQVKSPLYTIWRGMKNRCNTDTYIDHHRYKDRGITVCKEWSDSFIAFRDWALFNGYKEGLQIDRIENNEGYSPNNCRFVTNIINVNNREITVMVLYSGKLVSLSLLLRNKNLHEHYAAISGRIGRGWKAQKAIDTPIRKGRYKKGSRQAGVIEAGSKDFQCLGKES